MKNGLTVAQVYAQIAEALTSETSSTTLAWEGENYEVIGSDKDEADVTVDTLKNLTLQGTDSSGNAVDVKLSDIAEMQEKDSLPSITRDNQRTYLTVTGEL